MGHIRDFYNAIAEDSAKRWYADPVLQPTIDEFMSHLPASPRILDLGCGAGYESMRLSRAGARVVGIDFAERALEIAIARNPQCNFHLLAFEDISSDLGQFDGIFASASLIHVAPDRLTALLGKLRELLIDGGVFLAILHLGSGHKETWVDIYGRRLLGSAYGYTPSAIRSLCESAGYA